MERLKCKADKYFVRSRILETGVYYSFFKFRVCGRSVYCTEYVANYVENSRQISGTNVEHSPCRRNCMPSEPMQLDIICFASVYNKVYTKIRYFVHYFIHENEMRSNTVV